MNKKKRRVLIIVRGVKPVRFKNKIIESIKKNLLEILSTRKGIINKEYNSFSEYLKNDYDLIEVLKWDGDIVRDPSLKLPVKELKEILDRHQKDHIDVVAVSLGGHVLEKALFNPKIKINKLLYICSMHNVHHRIKNVKKTINIYSSKDNMYKFANDLFEGFGNFILKGPRVINIAFEDLMHDDFLVNKKINKKGIKQKYLYEFYRSLLIKK